MTRKEYEIVCRVINDARTAFSDKTPEARYYENMRVYIANQLAEAFGLEGMQEDIFRKKAGLLPQR